MQSKLILLAASAAFLSSQFALAQGDECTGALAVVNGANGPFTNVGSTTSVPAWPCGAGGNDVWFSYVATATGSCTIDLCGGTYDTALQVFDGTGGCGGLVSLGCNDDSCGLQSSVTFPATQGTTYYIRMGGYGGATGTAPVNVTPPTPPVPNTLTTNFRGNTYVSPQTFFFDLTINVPLFFTGMDVNVLEIANTPGSIDVYTTPNTYVGNDTNPAAWTLLGNGTLISAGPNVPTPVTLGSFPPLVPGTYGIAIQYNGVNGLYGGVGATYTTPEMTLVTGASAPGLLGTAICCTPREWNGTIRYAPAGSGTVALQQSYGAGCYDSKLGSFYEEFPAGTFDLSNSSIQMLYTGTGYVLTPGSTNWFTPVAGNLGLTDDSVSTPQLMPFTLPFPGGSTNNLWISSNGFVALEATTNSWCCTGNAAGLLSDVARVCAIWGDLNPTSVGSVHFDVDPNNTAAYVTFVGVPEYGQTNSNTFQIAFFNSGIVELRFQGCANATHQVLTGFSMGHNATDPGPLDLSVSVPNTVVTGPFQIPLALAASARPLAGTTIQMAISNIPGPYLALLLVNYGAVIPGLDLGPLGMPGCLQHIALGGAVTIGAVVGNGSVPFGIPAGTTYLGTNVFLQAAALVPNVNPLGGLSSNGVRLVVGNL